MNSTEPKLARSGPRLGKRAPARARAGQIAQRTQTIRKTIKEPYPLFICVSDMCTEVPLLSLLRKTGSPTTDDGERASTNLYQPQYQTARALIWSTPNSNLGDPLGITNLTRTPPQSSVHAHPRSLRHSRHVPSDLAWYSLIGRADEHHKHARVLKHGPGGRGRTGERLATVG